MNATATLNANQVNGIVRVQGEAMGAFWQNGNGRWSVRIEGFSVTVVPTLAAVRRHVRETLAN